MTWYAWRQQRAETLIGAAVVVLLALLFVPTGIQIAHAYRADGAAACVATHAEGCSQLLNAFDDRFAAILGVTDWFALLPVLIALIFAAPFALELERGTYRLAWTQSITRRRWLVSKLAITLGSAGLCALATTVLLTWWRRPLDNFHGRIEPGAFQLEGIAPIAYTLFAAVLMITLGAILRRTIPAIAISIIAFLAVRIAIETAVRPHFASPLQAKDGDNLDTAWVIHGQAYHPSSRFWEFQGIETGIYLIIALAILALTAWWIDNRVS